MFIRSHRVRNLRILFSPSITNITANVMFREVKRSMHISILHQFRRLPIVKLLTMRKKLTRLFHNNIDRILRHTFQNSKSFHMVESFFLGKTQRNATTNILSNRPNHHFFHRVSFMLTRHHTTIDNSILTPRTNHVIFNLMNGLLNNSRVLPYAIGAHPLPLQLYYNYQRRRNRTRRNHWRRCFFVRTSFYRFRNGRPFFIGCSQL